MKLSEFIQETLWEIASGVRAGAIRARPFVAIAPADIDGQKVAETAYVEFDISLLVSEKSKSSKGGGSSLGGEIKVAPFAKISLGAKGDISQSTDATEEQTHRVAFKVPIHFAANFRHQPQVDAAERDFASKVMAEDQPVVGLDRANSVR